MTIDYSKWDHIDDDEDDDSIAAESPHNNSNDSNEKDSVEVGIEVGKLAGLVDVEDFKQFHIKLAVQFAILLAQKKGSDSKPIKANTSELLEMISMYLDQNTTEKNTKLLKNFVQSSKRGTVLVNKFLVSSAKDYNTAPLLLAKAHDGVAKFHKDFLKDYESGKVMKNFKAYGNGVSDYLWDLALKFRIDAIQIHECMNVDYGNGFTSDFLGEILFFLDEFCPNKLGVEEDLDQKNRLYRFMFPMLILVDALSATLEFVRYRSGCVHVAEHMTFLDTLLRLPLKHIFLLQQKHSMATYLDFADCFERPIMYGMIEQGFMDILGRCLNGLDKRPDLYAAVGTKINTKLDATFTSHMNKVKIKIGKISRQPGLEFAATAINLTKSLQKLRAISAAKCHADALELTGAYAKNGDGGWKSTFCMERHIMTTKHAKKNRSGRKSDDALVARAFCYVCDTGGDISIDVFRCSSCKTNLYCSKECQAKDWKEHRAECVQQSGTYDVTSGFCCLSTFQWVQEKCEVGNGKTNSTFIHAQASGRFV